MRVPRRFQRLVPRLARCLVTAAVLAGYLCATIGFPQVQAVVKDTSRPFPCQGHACGCMTAEQCFDHCCCYSREEKQAWATANLVELPPVPAETDGSWHTPRQRDQEAAADCQQSCCHGDKAEDDSVRWVIAIQARACHGAGALWISQNPTPPPPAWTDWSYEWAPAGWLSQAASVNPLTSYPPPSPPPRG